MIEVELEAHLPRSACGGAVARRLPAAGLAEWMTPLTVWTIRPVDEVRLVRRVAREDGGVNRHRRQPSKSSRRRDAEGRSLSPVL